MSGWLEQIDGDPMLSGSAQLLARVMLDNFSAGASGYINGRDSEFAEVMNTSVRTAAEARRELVHRGHLIPLSGRMAVPSFRLSTSRW